MENEADVIPVKDALNGSELEGRTLRADLARRKTMHEKTPGRCKNRIIAAIVSAI